MGIEILKICVVYCYKGEVMEEFFVSLKIFVECEFVYEEFLGWIEDIMGVKILDELFDNVCYYLECVF